MARIETIERTLYQFGELNDDAKEQSRAWYRGCIESDELANDGDDWETIAGILGVEFDTRPVKLMGGGTRHENVIYWELHPTSAAFAGRYNYAKQAPKRIREHAPQDTELHRIADELQRVQRVAFYSIYATCETGGRQGTSQKSSAESERGFYPECEKVEELLCDFAAWIGSQIEAQRDWLYSQEVVDDNIAANGYEFTESGAIA